MLIQAMEAWIGLKTVCLFVLLTLLVQSDLSFRGLNLFINLTTSTKSFISFPMVALLLF